MPCPALKGELLKKSDLRGPLYKILAWAISPEQNQNLLQQEFSTWVGHRGCFERALYRSIGWFSSVQTTRILAEQLTRATAFREVLWRSVP